MKKTTITIIIPVFNVENVVSETLLSVKNQSVPADEVIIVNDGSTDNSFDKINNFKDLKGWKILQTENQGLGLTRNFGKSFAKSEYIYFLDSDDIIKDDFIEKIHKVILKNDKPDMILFSGETFGDTYKQNKVNLKFSVHGKFYQNDKLITKLVKKNETLPQVSRYITKLNLWSKNDLYFPEGIAEDEAVFFPLLSLSENTIIITDVYYKYRVGRPGSISLKDPDPKHSIDYLNRISFFMNFMKKKKKLIKGDIAAWRFRLERKGLNYISSCLKTKTQVNWFKMIILFYNIRSVGFLFKLIWRYIRYFFSILTFKNK